MRCSWLSFFLGYHRLPQTLSNCHTHTSLNTVLPTHGKSRTLCALPAWVQSTTTVKVFIEFRFTPFVIRVLMRCTPESGPWATRSGVKSDLRACRCSRLHTLPSPRQDQASRSEKAGNDVCLVSILFRWWACNGNSLERPGGNR